MEKLIEEIEELKVCLDNIDLIKDIKKINSDIYKDKELIRLLEEYSNNPNDDIKRKILNNELFQEYKDKETELNILILQINSKLKEISNKDKCCG